MNTVANTSSADDITNTIIIQEAKRLLNAIVDKTPVEGEDYKSMPGLYAQALWDYYTYKLAWAEEGRLTAPQAQAIAWIKVQPDGYSNPKQWWDWWRGLV